jgi:hypothetical protein
MLRNVLNVMAVMALVLGLVSMASAGPVNSLLDPTTFPSLGALDITATDSVTFDTGTLTVSGTHSGGTPFSWSGVDWQTGDDDGDGETVRAAAFSFDSVTIALGASVAVQSTGSRRALVVTATGDITVKAGLDLSGSNGVGGSGGSGAPGSEGGIAEMGDGTNDGDGTFSVLPGSAAGDGGSSNAGDGVGYGGGQGYTSNAGGGGGFGGYGGRGGYQLDGGSGGLRDDATGAFTMGDATLNELYGGSGGGARLGGGGGGGGAIELTCLGTLTITGTIDVSGGDAADVASGNGGGGSGGGILLCAPTIDLDDGVNTAFLDASGGDGGYIGGADSVRGGGGGGGRIAIYADSYLPGGGALSVARGVVGRNNNQGQDGTTSFNEFEAFPLVSEPAGLGLLGLALLGLKKRRS